MSLHTIILAAGQGSRMKSNRAKALQRVGGSSMLKKICDTAGSISPDITLVVGFDKESIIEESNSYPLNISIAEQPNPIGTGDAVKCGMKSVESATKILVLYGDVPLIKKETLEKIGSSEFIDYKPGKNPSKTSQKKFKLAAYKSLDYLFYLGSIYNSN